MTKEDLQLYTREACSCKGNELDHRRADEGFCFVLFISLDSYYFWKIETLAEERRVSSKKLFEDCLHDRIASFLDAEDYKD